jgi:hypothetical protein
MRIEAYQPQIVGDQIKAFLSGEFEAVPGQHPEFQMGFAALRRTHLVELARRYGLELTPGMDKNTMLPQFEIWWQQGKFPIRKPADDVAALKIRMEQLERQNAALVERMNGTTGIVPPAVPPALPAEDAGEVAAPSTASAPPSEASAKEGVMAEIEKLSIMDLRKFCKKVGINSYGKSREQLVEEVREAHGSDPATDSQ